jgi:hypothetical protein
MKTRFLAITAMLMFLVTVTMAETKSVDDVKTPTAAAKLLERKISVPSEADLTSESTYVAFELRVNEDKTIEYVPISASTSVLSKNVERQIKRLESSLTKVIEPGTAQRFKLNFKTL